MAGNEAEELLARARRLRERIAGGADEGRETLDDLTFLARQIRGVRARARAVRAFVAGLDPILRPIGLVLGPLWRAASGLVRFATCEREADGTRGLAGLSLRRTAISAAVTLGVSAALLAAYAYGTRERGRFIISNYQLVDAEEDTYQMGGCPKRTPGQTECSPGESEIMLVHPDWLSTIAQLLGADEGVLGIDAFLFDEIAGGIPQQGECELSRYGVYFRPPPLLRMLRGTTKRHVVHVGTCEVYGIRATP